MKIETAKQKEWSPDKPCLKGAFPFRLGTTSYIIPNDILPNLIYLKDKIDDVELVLFESDEFSNLPSSETVREFADLGQKNNLTYTVHLPLDIRLGSANEMERRASVEKCQRVINLTTPLHPFAWILHLHGDHAGTPPTDDLPRWLEQNRRSLKELLNGGPTPRKICVETLDYDFNLVENLVEEFDLSVCLDMGHLIYHKYNVSAHLERWLDRARVFHIHGINNDGRDHCSLSYFPSGLLEDVAWRLSKLSSEDQRVVTMEIFGEADFKTSLQTISERLTPWRK